MKIIFYKLRERKIMKPHRIWGMILRHYFLFKRSLDRLFDAFYFPSIDLIIWGLTSQYIKQSFGGASFLPVIIISGILFWIIVWRSMYEVAINVLEELWNKNLINLFITPFTFQEWMVSLVILGILKTMISFGFAVIVAFFLYQTHIFQFGLYLIPFIFLLMMTGWSIGFFVSGVIFRYGTKIQILAWSIGNLLMPLSGIFYPISILPTWAQNISLFVPTRYVFAGVRQVIETGTLDINTIFVCFLLNAIYLILSLLYLRDSFQKVLERGMISIK